MGPTCNLTPSCHGCDFMVLEHDITCDFHTRGISRISVILRVIEIDLTCGFLHYVLCLEVAEHTAAEKNE